MKRYAVLLLFALFAATVMGEDITTIDGTVYKDIRITETTPIGLNFVSNDKACWVDFRDLPPDVAQKYGYDPAKAAEFEKALSQNQGSVVPGNPADMVADKAELERDTIPEAAPPVPAQGVNVAVNTPVASASVTIAPPPPQVIVVNNGDTVVYDDQIVYEPTTTVWVSWCGRYYPRSYWHYWYWKDRYVYCDGRYYPAHCYYRGGVWDHGKYYKYAPDPHRNFPSGNRDSRLSYSVRGDNRGTSRNQAVTNNDRGSNKNQAAASDNRSYSQAQTVSNDNRGKFQNVANENRKPSVPVQVDKQNVAKTQNVSNDNRGASQPTPVVNDNRTRVQNVVNENRKAPVTTQVDSQSTVKTQNVVYDNRGTSQTTPVVNDNRTRVQNVVNENRKVPVTTQVDSQSTVKTQNVVYDNRGSARTQNVVYDNRGTSQTTPVVNDNRTRVQNISNDNRGTSQTPQVIPGRVPVVTENPRAVQPAAVDSHVPGVPSAVTTQGISDRSGGDNFRGGDHGDRGDGRR